MSQQSDAAFPDVYVYDVIVLLDSSHERSDRKAIKLIKRIIPENNFNPTQSYLTSGLACPDMNYRNCKA